MDTRPKRLEKDKYNIVLANIPKEVLIDLEKHLHRNWCDYVKILAANSCISENEIDEEWHCMVSPHDF